MLRGDTRPAPLRIPRSSRASGPFAGPSSRTSSSNSRTPGSTVDSMSFYSTHPPDAASRPGLGKDETPLHDPTPMPAVRTRRILNARSRPGSDPRRTQDASTGSSVDGGAAEPTTPAAQVRTSSRLKPKPGRNASGASSSSGSKSSHSRTASDASVASDPVQPADDAPSSSTRKLRSRNAPADEVPDPPPLPARRSLKRGANTTQERPTREPSVDALSESSLSSLADSDDDGGADEAAPDTSNGSNGSAKYEGTSSIDEPPSPVEKAKMRHLDQSTSTSSALAATTAAVVEAQRKKSSTPSSVLVASSSATSPRHARTGKAFVAGPLKAVPASASKKAKTVIRVTGVGSNDDPTSKSASAPISPVAGSKESGKLPLRGRARGVLGGARARPSSVGPSAIPSTSLLSVPMTASASLPLPSLTGPGTGAGKLRGRAAEIAAEEGGTRSGGSGKGRKRSRSPAVYTPRSRRKKTDAERAEIDAKRQKLLAELDEEERLLRSSEHPLLLELQRLVDAGRTKKLDQLRRRHEALEGSLEKVYEERRDRVTTTFSDKSTAMRTDMLLDVQLKMRQAEVELTMGNYHYTLNCQSALNLTFPPPAAPYFPRTDPALLRPNETSEPFSLVEGLDRQRLVHHDVWNLRRDEVEMDLAYLKGLDRDPPVVTPPEPPRQVAVEPPAPVPWQQESPPPGPFQWAAAPQAPQPLVRPPHQPPLQFQEPMPAIPQPPLLYQPAQPPIGPDPRSMQPTYGHQVLLESNLGRPGPGPGPPTVQPGHDDARLRAQLESYGWSSEVPDGRAGVRSGRSR